MSVIVKHEKGLAMKGIFSKNSGSEYVKPAVSESIWISALNLFLPF
ncbi:hypothetical protein BN134_3234 [Cronobacter dublinensis 1210]|uniref:Uncharacterized protein n=2 Tax=Cronobacter TaxID=413496 RepID=K8A194_9ENTR|nr:hypothetical protein BN137_2104 [Cronobacter condimenti 1330]CCJ82473.1 hypothetical protein BN134_3234 [Cronobacter dublinensis 1210]